jgi:carbonic anhydrase
MGRDWQRLMKHRIISVLVLALMPVLAGSGFATPTTKGPSAADALRRLLEGNARYVRNDLEPPNRRPSAAPQHPLAVILSCSDSRVPPEIIFYQGVGDLFVVRVAGNTYDRLALESIEYAVGHLGTKLILVLGHDQCGAVTAAVKSYPNPAVGPMIANIYPAVRATHDKPGDPASNAISENAALIAKRLAGEPHLAAEVQNGELKVVPARYSLDTGVVRILPNNDAPIPHVH